MPGAVSEGDATLEWSRESERQGVGEFWLHHKLTQWLSANYLIPFRVGFRDCNVKIIITLPSQECGTAKRDDVYRAFSAISGIWGAQHECKPPLYL